jgi:DnaJ-class molecular chaperone
MDDYRTLNVPRTASVDDVKKAYRKLAKLHHPDYNKGDPQTATRFSQITEAYDHILSGNPRIPVVNTKPKKTPPQTIIELTATATLRSSFKGTFVIYDDRKITISRGFTKDEVYTSQIDQNIQIKLTMGFKEWKGFDLDDRDLITTMRVAKKDIRSGKKLVVPNHPNPDPVWVTFNSDRRSGDVACFTGLGLPNHNGSPGDLFVTVNFQRNFWSELVQWIILLMVITNLYYLFGNRH